MGVTRMYIYEKSKKQKQKKLKLQIIYQIHNCSIYCTLGQGVCRKVPVGYFAPRNVSFFSFFRFLLLSKIELTSLFQRITMILDGSNLTNLAFNHNHHEVSAIVIATHITAI
eukprot:TRINITY_DN4469_c0_g1_i2.p1 TRINITY_DN4469_c0_g1~~TRINITY_DN4469_c0_g1_i2.p1  ORF type:complete len:112 (-),score=5.15 TRINITY_DN4469_c0_g1_i2:623-958(-)